MTDTTTAAPAPASALPNNQLLITTGLGALLGQFLDSVAQAHGLPLPAGTCSSVLTAVLYYITGRGRR